MLANGSPYDEVARAIGEWIADLAKEIGDFFSGENFDMPSLGQTGYSPDPNPGENLANVLNGASSAAGGVSYGSSIGPSLGIPSSGNRETYCRN